MSYSEYVNLKSDHIRTIIPTTDLASLIFDSQIFTD